MLKRARVIFLAVALAGCGTNTMINPVAEQTIPRPAAGKAQIVFLRPSNYFPEMASLLYEVGAGKDTFIAPIGGMNKVVYDVAPGRWLFMSNNGVMAHFLKADLEAGKRYYVLVRPIHGYGFQLRPLRKDGTTDYNTSVREFPVWLVGTTSVEASDSAAATISRAQSGFDKTKAAGWAEWQAKSASQISELTLIREDGFAS
jgi:hypothetical protein